MYEFKDLKPSKDGKHKYEVELLNTDTGRSKTVKFGAKGYTDFTISKDKGKKDLYIARHKEREDWSKSGVATAGFWSKHILWNKETIDASLKDVKQKFFKK
jgi:hypothetical protein